MKKLMIAALALLFCIGAVQAQTLDRILKDKKIRVLAKLFGGQGTMNVPSWSPDGAKLAFVSYQLLPEESVR